MQRVSDHQVGSPDDLASELLDRRDEILLVGDGALRYQEAFEGLKRVEIADPGFAHPSAASLVQLAHAQALREQFVAPVGAHAALPAQARRRDQLVDAGG